MSAPTRTGRSPLLAAVLTGLGPGAGHFYAGRPARGLALVALLGVTCLGWIVQSPRSFGAAKAFAMPPMLLMVGMVADSAVLARRAPSSFRPGPLQRWWACATVVVITGVIAPTALAWTLEQRAGLVQVGDTSMYPWLLPSDLLLHEKTVAARSRIARGDVVVVAHDGDRKVRRVVGLPGEKVTVRRGAVLIGGLPWIEDARRAALAGDLSAGPAAAGADELLVLPDRRRPGDAEGWRIARSSVIGRVSYVLVPEGLAPERMGEPVR